MNVYLRRDGFLRGFVYDFISMFAPHVQRRSIERALQDGAPASGAEDADLPFAENR